MKSRKVKSFHQKQCKNVFHRDINIGLMGMKEVKEKSAVFLICERVTDTDRHTTGN